MLTIKIDSNTVYDALAWHMRQRPIVIPGGKLSAIIKQEYLDARKWEKLAQENPALCKELQSLVDSAPLPVYTDNSDFPEPGL
jgi:hypothetical protein